MQLHDRPRSASRCAVPVVLIPLAAAILAACAAEASSTQRPVNPAGRHVAAATTSPTSFVSRATATGTPGTPRTTGPASRAARDTTGTPAAVSPLPPTRFAKGGGAREDTARTDPHRYVWRGKPPEPAYSVAPLPGALLPQKRIVVYYGNPYSKRMGVLGEYPVSVMLGKLEQEVRAFQQADPSTPVQPGLHLIVTVAQGSPGRDGMYRLRMGDSVITSWIDLAASRGYVIFLDVQVGKSTVQAELPRLIPYLRRPNVHLALDPEFSMHYRSAGVPPGRKIGVMDATDVNYAIGLLDRVVRENRLPPKVLVVHRFTKPMLTNYRQIRPLPTVQVVVNMDGFGPPWLKRDSYNDYERMQPVQFTGFKLFYKNDRPMLSRREVVELQPSPRFITFQ